MPEFPDYFRDKVIDDEEPLWLKPKTMRLLQPQSLKNDECDRIRTEKGLAADSQPLSITTYYPRERANPACDAGSGRPHTWASYKPSPTCVS